MFLIVESKFKPILKSLFDKVSGISVINTDNILDWIANNPKSIFSQKVIVNAKDSNLYLPKGVFDGNQFVINVYQLDEVDYVKFIGQINLLTFDTILDSLISYFVFTNNTVFNLAKTCSDLPIPSGNNNYIFDNEFNREVVQLPPYQKLSLTNCIAQKVNETKELTICGQYKDISTNGQTQRTLFNFFNLNFDNAVAVFIENTNRFYYFDIKSNTKFYTKTYDLTKQHFVCLGLKINSDNISVKLSIDGETQINKTLTDIYFSEFKGNYGLIGADFDNGEQDINDDVYAKLASFMIFNEYLSDTQIQNLFTLTKTI